MKKILLTALALFLGVSMYAQEKALTKLSAADAPANVASAGKTVARGATQERAAVELTIYEDAGDTQRFAPIYTYYGDTQDSGAQFVVPASMLTDMQGGQITSLKFYINPAQNYLTEYLSTPTYSGYMTEVASETMTEFIDFNSATNIFNGNIALTDDCLIIDLATPYTYNGGNLAIAFVCTDPGQFCAIYYYSETVTGGSIYRSNSVNPVNIVNYVPKTTFTYIGGEEPEPECDPITTFPYVNDFENFLDNHDCWVSIDADGDGEDWITGTQVYWEEGVGVDGSHCIASESYNDAASASYNADNYLLSPKFELPADKTVTLSWKAMGMWGWGDNYSVLIAPNGSTNISDFESVYNEAGQYAWTERTVDLTEYAGTTVRVVFRHNDSGNFAILIDDMSITVADVPEPECDPITTFPYVNDFENFLDEKDCWVSIDNDGDGEDWITGTQQSGAYSGINYSTCLVSKSYDYVDDTPYTYNADNYLLTPEIVLPADGAATLLWHAKSSYGPTYPDWYEVMVAPNGSTNINDFVSLYNEDAPADWEERSVSLAAYAGTTVRVVFHHQDSDNYYVLIDDMSITMGDTPEPECHPITTFPYFNDFEDFLDNHDCWVSIDADGDGYDWLTGTTYGWGNELGADASNCIISQSYANYAGSLNADNYILTPEFELPAGNTITLSWMVANQDPDWPDTYEVLVAPNGSTEISDFVSLLTEAPENEDAQEFLERSLDLTDYAGTTVRVVFRHHDSDMFYIKIDNLGITAEGGDTPEPECDPITTFPYFNDFENFLAEKDCWVSIDNDGDGHDWLTGTESWWNQGIGVGYSNALVSESYLNEGYVVLNADNYILTPEINLPADKQITLSWAAAASYQDYYEVLVAPNGSTEVSDFVLLFSDAPMTSLYVTQTADLTNYAGTTVRVVFRNQMSDGFIVTIDNLGITAEGGDTPEPECDPITTFPYFNDFENFLAEKDCWVSIDNDGDGHDWLTGTAQSGMFNGYNYSFGLVSKSYNYDDEAGVGTDLDADNYLVSPEFVLPANGTVTLSWYAMSTGGENWPDYYEVMIAPNGSTEISDFVSVLGEDAPIDWEERTADISAYAGTTVRVVFHHQDFAQYWVIIDNLGVTVEGGVDPEPGNFPYLETFDVNGMDDWSNLDEDGDGHIWELAAGYTGQGAKSVSWQSSYKGSDAARRDNAAQKENGKASYDPDNWLISPEVTIPATAGQENPVQLSWYVQSGSNSFPEHYGVYVSTTGDQPADFTTQLYEGTSPSTNWTQLSVDLNAYIGQTIRVAFRHYDSYDKWHFTIDNIEIKEYEEPEPVECDPITTFPYFNDFEDFLTNHDCWIDIDNDGDGQTWLTGTTNYGTMGWGVNASNCLVSQSYDNNVGAYNADNYLVSPEFELPTTVEEALILSWFEQSQDASYPDSYEVMIAPNGSTEIADFVSIYSGVAANPWTERTFDISSYAGQTIRVVFHHQSSDCYMLEIDNMSIYDGQGPEPVDCDPITDFPYFNDFENFPAEKDCWISIDNDGDGHDWLTGTTHLWGNGLGVDESNCLVSESYLYDTGIALDADNYLLSPEFVLPAGENIKLSWFAQAQDPSYPDSYEVMIAPNGSTEISDFVSVYGEVSTNPWAERYVDISAYAGTTVRVVFHHQDYDNFFVEIDNMGIEVYTGVNEDNDTEFAVYPNPVKNTMTLTGVEVGTEVRIYDLAGNTVMSFVYEGQIVNVENLANGVYVLRANDSMIKIVK